MKPSNRIILAAAIQMNSGPDKNANLEKAEQLIRNAASLGAKFIGLPENFSWMGPESRRAELAESLDSSTLLQFEKLACELGVTLLAGSVSETGAPGGRVYNTSVLFGPDGSWLGIYRKIHLFDVDVGDGATYQESATVAPGNQEVVANTPIGVMGLSICYDLRFPELYRRLANRGATVLTVPAAFTLMTGKDHWEVLLRARAIENQAYVVAPAQWGRHSDKRVTYGHAMIVNPWGTVVAQASDGEGFALGPIDCELTSQIRSSLPALTHRRLDTT